MARETSAAIVRGIALAAAVVAIAGLAACGDDDDSPDSTAPAGESAQAIESFGEEASPEDGDAASAAVQEFLRAQAEGDSATACSLMAASTKENLELFVEGAASESVKLSCTEQVETVRKQIPAKTLAQGERIQVTGVRIEGDRGYVLYRDAEGTDSAFAVVREGSAWKVGVIAGTPVP